MATKLIIDVDNSVSLEEALMAVTIVVKGGYVSQAANILHFCWATVFPNGVEVITRHKKNDHAADSFIVIRKESNNAEGKNG